MPQPNYHSFAVTINQKASQHDRELLVARLTELGADEQSPGYYTRGLTEHTLDELEALLVSGLEDPKSVSAHLFTTSERSSGGDPRPDITI